MLLLESVINVMVSVMIVFSSTQETQAELCYFSRRQLLYDSSSSMSVEKE